MAAAALDGIIGHSAPMQAVAGLVMKVAPHDCAVLIHGESGTGKELIARSVQKNSKRAEGPFVTLNCGAIPETLTEAILFGHQKGSFTGASSDKRGLFETAHGGTIFLDEIAEMPLSTQVKLLRTLQEKEIVRVGATKHIKVDVRVIAATNQELKGMIAEGRFRQDLYYRISTFEIQVAPLRDRRADIPLLANHFLDKLSISGCHPLPMTIEEDALNALAIHDWQGNVRELENVMNRLIVLARTSTITRFDVENVLGSDSSLQRYPPRPFTAPTLALSLQLARTTHTARGGSHSPRSRSCRVPSVVGQCGEDHQLHSRHRWSHRQARLERKHRSSDCTFKRRVNNVVC